MKTLKIRHKRYKRSLWIEHSGMQKWCHLSIYTPDYTDFPLTAKQARRAAAALLKAAEEMEKEK